ncbi:PREDICTED: leucine-rich repeat-containing protein 61-like isoform X1 [Branchiostoma belcheri]|uniref:Leucine-rich repeat-containing protein 61-like isoform X1 n=1 Tax=Branchiostoma belcheri TaxID=7741 RepID=A0A6P5A9X7_BRABE|nr:PREDICTED: leucine-rich repeat-containing protein 61-like isoform X1 [Branchiostoma belcheri]
MSEDTEKGAGEPKPLAHITRQALKTHSGEFELDSITYINFRDRGISDLGCIGECTNLQHLNVSMNDISRLAPLSSLKHLLTLDISANRITQLDALKDADSLQTLNAAGNLISSIDKLACLAKLEHFSNLRLQDKVHELFNPVCHGASYKKRVLSMMPRLKVLDGEVLSGKGSEVFRICSEIDATLQAAHDSGLYAINTSKPPSGASGIPTSGPIPEMSKPQPWFAGDSLKLKDTKAQDAAIDDVTKKFKDVLVDCQRLQEEGQRALDQAKSSSTQQGIDHLKNLDLSI